jgi:23S rRNA pseudouridine1911/1915/1917 synthase
VAKNDAAHAKLGEAFRQRTVKKTYIALVQGLLDKDQGRIELAIGRDPKNRTRMATQHKTWHGEALGNARAACTDWRALARVDSTTLVEVQLHTGRTHQIRVHFSALKHPVVGDTLYGAAAQLRVPRAAAALEKVRSVGTPKKVRAAAVSEITELPPLGRNFLHAAKLGFAQPSSGQWIEVRAPLPSELRSFLKELAAAANEDAQRIDAALAGYL